MANRELASRIDALQLELLAELDRRQVATGDGYRSMSSWVAARLDLSLDTARTLVRTMRRTESRLDLRDALANGEASLDRVAALSKIQEDIGLMLGLDIAGVEAAAARRVRTDTTDCATGNDRFLVLQPTLDEGWWKMWGGFDGVSGALIDTVLNDMAERLPNFPDGTKGDRSWRRATALFDLCVSDDPPPAHVTVFVDAKHAAESNANSGIVLEAGPNVSRQALEAILCDSATEVTARTEDGRYMDYGRRRRTVTPELKRALMEKYHGMCAIDGCSSRYRLEAHHLTPWPQGGKTKPEDLILLCWYDHQITVHERGFQPYEHPDHGRIRWRAPVYHHSDRPR